MNRYQHAGGGVENGANERGDGGPPERRRRRRRWEPVDERAVEVTNLRMRLDRISRTLGAGSIPVNELCRSPSPPPRYDARGKRVNTRYDRARDKLEAERFKLVTRLRELDPMFRPPPGMRPPKIIKKLTIPKEKEGTVNYIGLILGPRGRTQRRLEKEYMCRVAIRGKGSVKDGRARAPAHFADSDEQLHVLITAEGLDAQERIDKCRQRILDIITPRPDELNDHKQAQLRELAQLNGTLRDQDRDRTYGPTTARTNASTNSELDRDYQSLMATLSGNGTDAGPPENGAPAAAYPWLEPDAFATRKQPPPNEVALPHPGHISAPYRRYNSPSYGTQQGARYPQHYPPSVPGAPSWMNARPAAHPHYSGMMHRNAPPLPPEDLPPPPPDDIPPPPPPM